MRRISALTLDIDLIEKVDRWVVVPPVGGVVEEQSDGWLRDGPGTVVVWEHLDRVLPAHRPDGGWARRRFQQLGQRASSYLGMVFHRFLEGATGTDPLVITLNGEKVEPWNPFAPDEPERISLSEASFEIGLGDATGQVLLRPYILPSRDRFSSPDEFERLSGPAKWNRQQGLYVYRADRLIQSGGWCGLRAPDEHTKLARAAVDFQTDLDHAFRVNVAKMRVSLPAELRPMIERPVNELCRRAGAVYRRENPLRRFPSEEDVDRRVIDGAAVTLKAAAMEVGEYDALRKVMERVQLRAPDIAAALGW